jgi:excisionase family DNA binding protein
MLMQTGQAEVTQSSTHDDPAYSVPRSADYSGVSERTMWSLIKNGKVLALTIGRRTLIRKSSLDRFLSSCERGQ